MLNQSFTRSSSLSGRYNHNETFRFPSITEENITSTNNSMNNASFTSFHTSGSMNSYNSGSNGRSHSNVVLGGMFANHLSLQNNSNLNNSDRFHQNHNGFRGSSDSSLLKQSFNSTETSLLPSSSSNNNNTPGPSELYRLISTPLPNYKSILDRCQSHPHEACSFSLHAGCGHVYALHRLLRRQEFDEYKGEEADPNLYYEAVQEIMKACPRAVVRKQAVREEEDFMENHRSQLLLSSREVNNVDDAEDVRYEYPLSIAAEYGHCSEILRMLAKATTESPHYRAEVYRSLDYASLSNETVRILMEEYAGCVLERGDSEENEGDDDDCPLEKVSVCCFFLFLIWAIILYRLHLMFGLPNPFYFVYYTLGSVLVG